MKIKNSSKEWAEKRGAVLVGTPLKPIQDAERRLAAATRQRVLEQRLISTR